MITLALLLFSAACALGVASLLKIPAVPLLLLSGIVLNATGIILDESLLRDGLLLGLTFLVFAAGTELNPDRINKQKKGALAVGLTQFLTHGIIGFFVALLFGLDVLPALYIALALTASSTLIVVRILQQRRQFFEPFGRLVLGVLLIQDLLAILIITALSNLDTGVLGIVKSILMTLLLIALSWTFQRRLIPYLLAKFKPDEETLLILTLVVLFLFVGLSVTLDLPFIAGAFFAGFALSGFPEQGVIRGQLISLSDFFRVIFFTALGTALVLPDIEYLWLTVSLIVVVIMVSPLLILAVAERTGLSTRSAIEGSLLLAQASEFSLIIGLVGLNNQHISQNLFSVIALVTVVTMILTPFISTDVIAWRLTHLRPGQKKRKLEKMTLSNHILILGCGQSGLELLKKLTSLSKRILVIDDDPIAIEKIKEAGFEGVRGDAADPAVLDACGANSAHLIVSTMWRVSDNVKLLKILKGKRVIIRVFEESDAKRTVQLGGTPLISSHIAGEKFIGTLS